MRFMTIIAAFAALLLAAAPSRAESPSPEAETIAAARELVVTMKTTDNMKTILPTIMQNLKPAIVQNRPAVEKDYDAIMPAMLEIASARLPEITEAIAQIYARIFTASELREIQAFYLTPTGQKLRDKLPMITQVSMAAGQQFGKEMAADLRARITSELRKRGHNI